jgi:deazaflavin-dependent oxidoreductase (nitroreductase family)
VTASPHRPRLAELANRLLRTRWLVRAPILVFRARLGLVFAGRLLMLEHTGRVTGQRRYVVLEIVDTPSAGTYVVVSGFGERAQWWQNLRANPHARIWLGSRGPQHATAHPLTRREAVAALNGYANAHPRAWRNLRPTLESMLGAPINDLAGTDLPMTALRTQSPTRTTA